MKKAETIDEYIGGASQDVRAKLKELRILIKTIAPTAEEKISYGIPFYEYKGRLVYFAHAKDHIGLYIPPPIIADHTDELKQYVTSKSAVQFPLTEGLPRKLIKKLIKARMLYNEKQENKK